MSFTNKSSKGAKAVKSKLYTNISEVKTVTRDVSLSSGGFIELQLAENGSGYLKIHISSQKESWGSVLQAWRWINHGKDEENLKLLTEIRDAANLILETIYE